MRKKLLITIIILVTAVLLAGCTGTGTSTSWPGITLDGEVLYTAYGQSVYAINASNGNLVWEYPEKAGKTMFYAAPAVTEDGNLVSGDYGHFLHVINVKTGTGGTIFEAAGKWIAKPAVVDNVIYAANADGYLYALDMAGNVFWKFETGASNWSTPVVESGIVYLGSLDHSVYAIKASTGEKLWQADAGGAIIGEITASESDIFVGTVAKEIVAINKSDGSIDWRYQAADAIWSGPAAREGVLYFGDVAGNFYALNQADQKVLWQYQAGSGVVCAPLLAEDSIYFTVENGNLVKLDYTGAVVFNKPLNDKLYASPLQAGEQIIVGTTNKDTILISLDANGNQVWVLAQPK